VNVCVYGISPTYGSTDKRIDQGYRNPFAGSSWQLKFYTVVRNICRFTVWMLLDVTHLMPRNFEVISRVVTKFLHPYLRHLSSYTYITTQNDSQFLFYVIFCTNGTNAT